MGGLPTCTHGCLPCPRTQHLYALTLSVLSAAASCLYGTRAEYPCPLPSRTQNSYLLGAVPPAIICARATGVVGNCFSLQKEHDAAVKFFERAIQVAPNFTYAHTLLGHEYVYNEDFGKALVCFRNAIHNDSRHYNAWYGLGTIYYRQEKYELAEYVLSPPACLRPAIPGLDAHAPAHGRASRLPLSANASVRHA